MDSGTPPEDDDSKSHGADASRDEQVSRPSVQHPTNPQRGKKKADVPDNNDKDKAEASTNPKDK